MSWFYERPRNVETQHNGTMMLARTFGTWRLFGHDGTEQATPYMDALWRKAFRHAAAMRPRGWSPARVLVLGVATGRTFAVLRKRWPQCAVVGVDWEPALYALGRQIGVHAFRDDDPQTIVRFGDAASIVPALDGEFDLVVVDLFNGMAADRAVFDVAFADAIRARVASGGIVAVNAFRQPEAFATWETAFGAPRLLRYEGNRVGLFGPA